MRNMISKIGYGVSVVIILSMLAFVNVGQADGMGSEDSQSVETYHSQCDQQCNDTEGQGHSQCMGDCCSDTDKCNNDSHCVSQCEEYRLTLPEGSEKESTLDILERL